MPTGGPLLKVPKHVRGQSLYSALAMYANGAEPSTGGMSWRHTRTDGVCTQGWRDERGYWTGSVPSAGGVNWRRTRMESVLGAGGVNYVNGRRLYPGVQKRYSGVLHPTSDTIFVV